MAVAALQRWPQRCPNFRNAAMRRPHDIKIVATTGVAAHVTGVRTGDQQYRADSGNTEVRLVVVTPEGAASDRPLGAKFERCLKQAAPLLDAVVLRDPRATPQQRASLGVRALAALAAGCRAAGARSGGGGAGGHRPLLFIGDGDAEAAVCCGADGVHLPARAWLPRAPPPSGPSARPAGGAGARSAGLLSLAVHSADEAARAAALGADMLLLGTIFATPSHPSPDHRVLGPGVCEAAAARLKRSPAKPWLVGIGGLATTNCGQVIAAGANGCAVIRAVWDAPNPGLACQELHEAMARGWCLRHS